MSRLIWAELGGTQTLKGITLSPGDLLRIGKKRDVEGEIHLIGALKNHRSPAVPVSSLEKISASFSDTVGHLPRPQRCWVPDRADLHLMRGEVELRWADLRPGGQRRQELEAGSDGSGGHRSILARRGRSSHHGGHGVGPDVAHQLVHVHGAKVLVDTIELALLASPSPPHHPD
jgi:hypothetical protein